MLDQERVALALSKGMDPAYFDGRLSGIRKALVRALGPVGAQPYLIHRDQKRPLSRYALTLKPEQIRFVGEEEEEGAEISGAAGADSQPQDARFKTQHQEPVQ